MIKKIIVILIILFAVSSIAYDNFYTYRQISGTYIYNFPIAVPEGPKQGDHLTLKENGNFESDTWGHGTYEISGSTLSLNYEYEFGKAGLVTNIYRPLFWGEPRIDIESDLCYYFKKTH